MSGENCLTGMKVVSSTEVGDLFRADKVFDVVVWSTPATRDNLNNIRDLLIDTPGGGRVRLADVAEVRVAPNPNVIKREGASRRIDVHANVRGRPLGAVAQDVERRLAEVRFPLGYHAELLGEYTERQATQTRLLLYGVAAIVGIFLLLQAAYLPLGTDVKTPANDPVAVPQLRRVP